MSSLTTKIGSQSTGSSQKVGVATSTSSKAATSSVLVAAANTAATQKWYSGLGAYSTQVPAAKPVIVSQSVETSHVKSKPADEIIIRSSTSKKESTCPTGKCPDVLKREEQKALAMKMAAANEKKKIERKSTSKSQEVVKTTKPEDKKKVSKSEDKKKVSKSEDKKKVSKSKDKKLSCPKKKDDCSDSDSSCSSDSSSSCSSHSSSSCSSDSSSSCTTKCTESCHEDSCHDDPCSEPCHDDDSCPPISECEEQQCITECYPSVDPCRALTLKDLFRVMESKRACPEARKIAKDFLREVPCLPPCIGVKFWDEFCSEPHIGSCESGCKPVKSCAEIKYTVDNDCGGVRINEFAFSLEDLPCEGIVLSEVFPFGCKCVPSPFEICEYAKFKVYAYKKPKKCEDSILHCDDAKKVVDWCDSVRQNNTHIDIGLIHTCLKSLQGVSDGGDAKFSKKLEKCKTFLLDRQSGFHKSSCTECKKTRDKCHCDVPVVPDCPFCCYEVRGKWECNLETCCGDSCGPYECARYKIVFECDSFCHEDGSRLSEGLSFFSGSRFNRLIFSMKPQFLPFLLDCEDDCGDCEDPRAMKKKSKK